MVPASRARSGSASWSAPTQRARLGLVVDAGHSRPRGRSPGGGRRGGGGRGRGHDDRGRRARRGRWPGSPPAGRRCRSPPSPPAARRSPGWRRRPHDPRAAASGRPWRGTGGARRLWIGSITAADPVRWPDVHDRCSASGCVSRKARIRSRCDFVVRTTGPGGDDRGAGLGQVDPLGQRPAAWIWSSGTRTTLPRGVYGSGHRPSSGGWTLLPKHVSASRSSRRVQDRELQVGSGEVDGPLRRGHAARGRRVAVGAEVALPPRVRAAGDHEPDPVARGEAMGDRIELETDEAIRLARRRAGGSPR